jgi:hypothetical protein
MGLFSRKQRVQLEEFCCEFYDKNILTPVIGSVDLDENYFQAVKVSIADVDGKFAAIDSELFRAEMTFIRFEVFSLAWLHQLGDKHAAAQSAFTKRYLESRNRADIWDALEPYNQAIARSSTLGQTAETASGRAYLAFTNSMRAQLFDEWHKRGFEPEAVTRAANRLATDVAWKQGLTAGFLMSTLCQRLSCEANDEGQFRLVAVIRGLYDGAQEALKRVRIEVS